jgi:hypothetical protein
MKSQLEVGMYVEWAKVDSIKDESLFGFIHFYLIPIFGSQRCRVSHIEHNDVGPWISIEREGLPVTPRGHLNLFHWSWFQPSLSLEKN